MFQHQCPQSWQNTSYLMWRSSMELYRLMHTIRILYPILYKKSIGVLLNDKFIIIHYNVQFKRNKWNNMLQVTLDGSIKLQSLKVLDLYMQFFVSFENLINFNFNQLIRWSNSIETKKASIFSKNTFSY